MSASVGTPNLYPKEISRTVSVSAVLGVRCALPVAVRLAAVPDPLAALEEAGRAELLDVPDPAHPRVVAFPHPLMRAAVYGSGCRARGAARPPRLGRRRGP